MTNLMVARRDGTLLNKETGERYRLVRGKTLADADHPAVVANPDAFMPMTVDLRSDSEEAADADTRVLDDVRASLEQAQGDAERYREQLAVIADGLAARGLVDELTDTSYEGWLSAVVFGAIDQGTAAQPPAREVPAGDEPERVEAPKRTSRRKPQA